MAKFPTMDEFAKAVAEKALYDYEYKGKTISEWAELISSGELEPVVHGRWLDVGHKIRCSVCDNGVFLGTTDPVVHNAEKENFKYCPNCGARMDGE